MRLRVQRHPIEVPEKDPFQNDRLERKEPANALTQVIGSIDGPCVLALDAGWGNGKTTFVRMWSQHLRDQGFVVATFNAWTTDYCGDPFVALSTELTESIPFDPEEALGLKLNVLRDAAGDVIRRLAVDAVRRATADIVDLNCVLESSKNQNSGNQKRLTEYRESKDSLLQFRESLQDVAQSLAESNSNRPLVIMIDELDRCRPRYAVEFLEISKHIFNVNGIIFVISVNRKQLEHSVRALYGSDFDATGYLRRFFDLDFRLPDANRDALLDQMLLEIDMPNALRKSTDTVQSGDGFPLENMVRAMFSSGKLSVRDTEQYLRRLGLVIASFGDAERKFVVPATVAVVLRSIDRDIYYKFARGHISDSNVVESIFEMPEMFAVNKYRGDVESDYTKGLVLFEAGLIAATYEMAQKEFQAPYSGLLHKYRREVGSDELDNVPMEKRTTYAGQVLRYSERYRNKYWGFLRSIDRIELISTGFGLDPAKKDS